MQGSTLIWGAILAGGALLMAFLGYTYAYLTKFDRMKTLTVSWDSSYRPMIKIRERFSLRLPVLVNCLITMIAGLVLLFGDVFGELIDANPWYMNIFLLILYIFGHFLIFAIFLVICSAVAMSKNSYIKKKYRDVADIVDTTVFSELNND